MNNVIKQFTLADFQALVKELGEPTFRAKQLYEWIIQKQVQSYDDMTNIPQKLRDKLSNQYPLIPYRIFDKQESQDGTRKYILQFGDDTLVETVGMPSLHEGSNRLTVCCSTQVGCPMKCSFCATGKEGFTRNLTAYEITEQISCVSRDFNQRVSHVVVMGQGEPFLNYDNTLTALRSFNDPNSFGIGARHIVVSTCGIIKGIEQFSQEPEQFTLAISLHAAIQSKRDALMPEVHNQPLVQLKKALIQYVEQTNRRITLEYLMIKGVNDNREDLKALLSFAQGILCHINLLPINPIKGSLLHPSSQKTVSHWIQTLGNQGIEATLRTPRGRDIAGACGQLKNTLSRN